MTNTIKTALVGVVVGFANGLFGSGGGTILVPALQRYYDMETHKSHATALIVILPLTLLSAWLYLRAQPVDWQAVLWITSGGVFGGYVGPKLLNKISSKWLHRIFGAFMLAAAFRMIVG